MAIRNVPIDRLSNYYEAPKKLDELGFEFKERTEILACYDVLMIWVDKFAFLGKLISLNHHSNPDDPPDVRANFESGAVLDMEHTSTEPAHRHMAEKLRDGMGGIIPPISGNYKTTRELLEAMNPYAGGGWTSVDKEANARYRLILDAMKKKIEKHPSGGILVLAGDGFTSDRTLPLSFYAACSDIRNVSGAENWVYIYISRANAIDYYSAIFGPKFDYEERRSAPHN